MRLSPKNNLSIPKIFLEDKKLVFSFIRGVADTDFSYKLRNGNYPIISGSSKCNNFMVEISNFLEVEGFKVSRTFNYKINDKRLKKGYNIINRIDIYGHNQFISWIKLIGTWHPKNIRKIKLWQEKNSHKAVVCQMSRTTC